MIKNKCFQSTSNRQKSTETASATATRPTQSRKISTKNKKIEVRIRQFFSYKRSGRYKRLVEFEEKKFKKDRIKELLKNNKEIKEADLQEKWEDLYYDADQSSQQAAKKAVEESIKS